MFVEILRPFRGERDHVPGEIIEASHWTTLPQLIDMTYVREVPAPVDADEELRPARRTKRTPAQ